MVYNFKTITVVPTGKEFLDIVLSKTQRKTPTIIHPQFPISRIRKFYMRKVKFASQSFHDRLNIITEEFPILDDIHPFYSDLMNVLYDKDHYKLALGQINTAKHMVDNIAKDYLKLLKYGDSLYRCKQLKRAALGRMCTLMSRQSASLGYLEQVRQHLARLPSIDPQTRTLILCGYPNVGKSSFLNKITRANVDVQPYPFTTKSLFVGHTDYEYLRWQVIDTPGILDHPLEERNTIEMQSITAMAHLRAAILYLIDISESCGYSLKQQVSLFNSLKPLFINKPIIVVASKMDIKSMEELEGEDKALLDSILVDGVTLVTMSTMSDEGVAKVKQVACDILLQQRVEQKVKAKKSADFLHRMHVAEPVARDDKVRIPLVPESVKKAQLSKATKKDSDDEDDEMEEIDSDDEMTRPFYERAFNKNVWKKKYQLEDNEWKFDAIPEIIDGKNIADFIDPDILKRLEELEAEEDERMAALESKMEDEDEDSLDEDSKELANKIKERKKMIIVKNLEKKGPSKRTVFPRKNINTTTISDFQDELSELGVDTSAASERLRSASRSRGRKRERSDSKIPEEEMDAIKIAKLRSRSRSKTPAPGEGIRDLKQRMQVESIEKSTQKPANRDARKGPGDRHVFDFKPKHLLTGKRGGGKTDRR